MNDKLLAGLRALTHRDLEDGVHEQIAAALETKLEAMERELAAYRKREIPLRSGLGPEILAAQKEQDE